MATVAFEIENGIDHVLDDARAGDLPVLGHVTDQNHGCAGLLGEPDHRLHAGPDLGYGPRRRIGSVAPERLDGIDDDEIGALAFGNRRQNVLDIGFGGQQYLGLGGM